LTNANWTELAFEAVNTNEHIEIWAGVVFNSPGGKTVTATFQGLNTANCYISISEWPGILTTGGAGSNTGTGNTSSTGTLTPVSGYNTLIIAVSGHDGVLSSGPTGGFTALNTANQIAQSAYFWQPAGETAVAATWTYFSAPAWATAYAMFVGPVTRSTPTLWNSGDTTPSPLTDIFSLLGSFACTYNSAGGMARSQSSRSSGKWYFEGVFGTPNNTTTFGGLGVADATLVMNAFTVPGSADAVSSSYQTVGNICANSTTTGGQAAVTTQTIGVAVDVDNHLIYYAVNNAWQNGADPNTNTGGTDYVTTAPVFAFGQIVQSGSFVFFYLSANFGNAGTAFTYAPPTGFLPWDFSGTAFQSDSFQSNSFQEYGGTVTASFSVTADSGAPVEFLLGFRGDGATHMEIIAGRTADATAQLEALAAVHMDGLAPLESIIAVRTDDIAQLEAVGSFRADATAPLESTAVMKPADATAQLESLVAVLSDELVPVETLLSVHGDGPVQAEIVASYRADSAVPLESVAVMRPADATAPSEIIVTMKPADATVPLESLLGVHGDVIAPTEIISGVRSDAIVNLEWTVALRMDVVVPMEAVLSFSADATPLLEISVNMKPADATASVEVLAGRSADAIVSTEILAGRVADQIAPTEILLGVHGDDVVPQENLGALVVTGDGRVNLEIKALFQAGTVALSESLSARSADATALIEDVAGVRGDSGVPIEFTIKVRGDGSVLIEIRSSGGGGNSTRYWYISSAYIMSLLCLLLPY
jgi:hypothetical protein